MRNLLPVRAPQASAFSESQEHHSSTPLPLAALVEDAFDAGVDGAEVAEKLLEVEVQVREEVGLVDEHEAGRAEHRGVLEGLLLAFDYRVGHHPNVLTDPELRRADQVPDVLYDENVDVVQRELGEAGADHVRVTGYAVSFPSSSKRRRSVW